MIKKNIFIAFACLVSTYAFSQISMPCVHWTPQNFSNWISYGNCFYASNFSISDNENRELMASSQISIDNYASIFPDSSGSFSAILYNQYDIAWYEPVNSYNAIQYEKMEWGVRFDAITETRISNYVINGINFNDLLQPTINPFDPDQISIQADVSWQEDGQSTDILKPVWGFYFQDFERNTTNSDKNLWDWDEIETDHKFRFRFTPTATGIHKVHFHAVIDGYGYIELGSYEFNVSIGDSSKSFASKSSNGHFYQTDDKNVFFPVGHNITDIAVSCGCENGPNSFSENCAICWPTDTANICCGISEAKMGGQYLHNSDSTQIRENCYPVVSYQKLEDAIRRMKFSGANCYRFIMHQGFNEIEFEDLNDYSQRLYQAWEMDTILKLNKALDIKCQMVLNLQNPIFWNHFGISNWEWYIGDPCWHVGTQDRGWCYRRELGLDEPHQFFENNIAKSNWKKKLRYQFARWGYCPEVVSWELFEEINQVGGGGACEITYESGVPIYDFVGHAGEHSYYRTDFVRGIIADWIAEMATYIKDTLISNQNLLGVNYNGAYPLEDYFLSQYPYSDVSAQNPCMSAHFDYTASIPSLDIVSWNNYEETYKRYKRLAQADGHHYNHWYCPSIEDDEIAYHNISKMLYLGESGILGLDQDCDSSTYIRDCYATPFSGACSIGMGWHEGGRPDRWYQLAPIKQFVETKVFHNNNWSDNMVEPGWAESDGSGNLVEAIYLQNFNPESPKIAGVLMNRTWNYFTEGCITTPPNNDILPLAFQNLTIIDSELEPINFDGLGIDGIGIIKFYDMLNLNLLDSSLVVSLNGHVTLSDYPTLGGLNSAHKPIVFFTIDFIPGATIIRSSPLYETQSDNPQTSNPLAVISKGSSNIIITNYNDTNHSQSYPAEIYDSLGHKIVQTIFFNNTAFVDLSRFAAGMYILKFIETGKFIKLIVH